MDILVKVIGYTLLLYVYVSVFIFFDAIYRGRDLFHEPIFGIKIFNSTFFAIGCLIGLTVFFAAGFEKVLFFIPKNWEFLDEYGDGRSIKETVSYMLGFLASIGVLAKSFKKISKKEKK